MVFLIVFKIKYQTENLFQINGSAQKELPINKKSASVFQNLSALLVVYVLIFLLATD